MNAMTRRSRNTALGSVYRALRASVAASKDVFRSTLGLAAGFKLNLRAPAVARTTVILLRTALRARMLAVASTVRASILAVFRSDLGAVVALLFLRWLVMYARVAHARPLA
jgi:hypothetical protein